MELSKKAKTIWWLILIITGGTYLVLRYETLYDPQPNYSDLIVILVWIGLLISPIFSEMDLFGFQLKREIQETKHELMSKVLELKTEIQNSQSLNATVSPSFYFPAWPQPTAEQQLLVAEPYLKEVLYKTLKSYGVADRGGGADPYATPDSTQFLFGVRYNIESKIRSIWSHAISKEVTYPVPVSKIIAELMKLELLDPDIAYMIREVYSICSAAIHGNDVSEEQLRFVESNSPSLYAYLDALAGN